MFELISRAIFPLILLSYTISFLPATLLATLTRDRASPSTFKHRWFARFWSWFGPRTRQNHEPVVAPLFAQISGNVLDIGTGAGHWLDLYDKSRVTGITAVETNREQHPGLLRAARAAGLQDRVQVAGVSVEGLAGTGVPRGSFDAVLTLNVMCSAGDPEALAKAAYELLKPGGRWYVYEHVKAHSKSEFINWWQETLNNIWPFFLGGCSLCRETGDVLRRAGEWKEDTLRQPEGDSPYAVIPSIIGVLTKA